MTKQDRAFHDERTLLAWISDALGQTEVDRTVCHWADSLGGVATPDTVPGLGVTQTSWLFAYDAVSGEHDPDEGEWSTEIVYAAAAAIANLEGPLRYSVEFDEGAQIFSEPMR